jgi:hypothetical protein
MSRKIGDIVTVTPSKAWLVAGSKEFAKTRKAYGQIVGVHIFSTGSYDVVIFKIEKGVPSRWNYSELELKEGNVSNIPSQLVHNFKCGKCETCKFRFQCQTV